MPKFQLTPGSGALRHRVQLQTRVEVPDEYAQLVSTWTTVSHHSAEIDQNKMLSGNNADQTKASRDGMITLRWFGRELNPATDRFIFKNRVLNIVGVDNIGERNAWIKVRYHELIGAAAT